MDQITTHDVVAAAQRLMTAFAATDTDDYFDCFAPEATFVFHSEPDRLNSRGEYRVVWENWLKEGWQVSECASSNTHVQIAGPCAVFSHDVVTVIDVAGVRETLHERETIILPRRSLAACSPFTSIFLRHLLAQRRTHDERIQSPCRE